MAISSAQYAIGQCNPNSNRCSRFPSRKHLLLTVQPEQCFIGGIRCHNHQLVIELDNGDKLTLQGHEEGHLGNLTAPAQYSTFSLGDYQMKFRYSHHHLFLFFRCCHHLLQVLDILQNDYVAKQTEQLADKLSRIEYALYNDGQTGLINKVDQLIENQQSIKIDVEVMKAKAEAKSTRSRSK
jgi:hypothetical protein